MSRPVLASAIRARASYSIRAKSGEARRRWAVRSDTPARDAARLIDSPPARASRSRESPLCKFGGFGEPFRVKYARPRLPPGHRRTAAGPTNRRAP